MQQYTAHLFVHSVRIQRHAIGGVQQERRDQLLQLAGRRAICQAICIRGPVCDSGCALCIAERVPLRGDVATSARPRRGPVFERLEPGPRALKFHGVPCLRRRHCGRINAICDCAASAPLLHQRNLQQLPVLRVLPAGAPLLREIDLICRLQQHSDECFRQPLSFRGLLPQAAQSLASQASASSRVAPRAHCVAPACYCCSRGVFPDGAQTSWTTMTSSVRGWTWTMTTKVASRLVENSSTREKLSDWLTDCSTVTVLSNKPPTCLQLLASGSS